MNKHCRMKNQDRYHLNQVPIRINPGRNWAGVVGRPPHHGLIRDLRAVGWENDIFPAFLACLSLACAGPISLIGVACWGAASWPWHSFDGSSTLVL